MVEKILLLKGNEIKEFQNMERESLFSDFLQSSWKLNFWKENNWKSPKYFLTFPEFQKIFLNNFFSQ